MRDMRRGVRAMLHSVLQDGARVRLYRQARGSLPGYREGPAKLQIRCFILLSRFDEVLGSGVSEQYWWPRSHRLRRNWLVPGRCTATRFSIVEKATGTWIGRAGPWCPLDWPGTEVGWGIVASAQRRGYAVAAAAAAIDWA